MTMGDIYLGAGRIAEAVAAYSKVIEIEPRASAALLNRGVALERSSGCNAALTDYMAVLHLQPDSATALRNAVACLRALGRNEEAQRLLARGPVANRGYGR